MQPDRVVHAAHARAQWAELLSRVCFAGERILIVRRGQEVAALVPAGDLALLAQLADVADIQAARKAVEQCKGEPTTSWGELKRSLGLEP